MGAVNTITEDEWMRDVAGMVVGWLAATIAAIGLLLLVGDALLAFL